MNPTNIKTYLVGGAVRDHLLGRSVSDRDWVVVGATPKQLLNQGYQQIGNDFPCFLHPDTKEEYALARTERKSGKGHTGFICDFGVDVTLEEDLSRRDLTINAIAKTDEGDYIDPYAGIADLNAKVLRHVSPAFVEDPLRVLRVARFAARFAKLGFTVHTDTLALMTQLVDQGELNCLTPERVWKEMSRALAEEKPSEFFLVLRACGALKVLMPELDNLFGVPQTPLHHPEVDTGDHVMRVIDIAQQLFNTPIVTWAGLMHDLGKALTPVNQWPKHICHEIKGVPLVVAVSDRLKVPRDFKLLAMIVCEHHLRCHKVPEMRAATIVNLLQDIDAFRRPERLVYFTQACEADARGRLGFEQKDYPSAALLMACFEITKKIDAQPFLDAGYKGLKLAEKIRRQRVSNVAELIGATK